eukprot:752303-Hanusia_phi.AAC.5
MTETGCRKSGNGLKEERGDRGGERRSVEERTGRGRSEWSEQGDKSTGNHSVAVSVAHHKSHKHPLQRIRSLRLVLCRKMVFDRALLQLCLVGFVSSFYVSSPMPTKDMNSVRIRHRRTPAQPPLMKPLVRRGAGLTARRAETSSASDGTSSKFSWIDWYPVMPSKDLKKDQPNPIVLLGLDLVVWWHQPSGTWSCFADECPHRLAPLSEGRIDKNGNLQCAYHGWEFNQEGGCERIPQDATEQMKCDKKACAKSYPVMEEQSISASQRRGFVQLQKVLTRTLFQQQQTEQYWHSDNGFKGKAGNRPGWDPPAFCQRKDLAGSYLTAHEDLQLLLKSFSSSETREQGFNFRCCGGVCCVCVRSKRSHEGPAMHWHVLRVSLLNYQIVCTCAFLLSLGVKALSDHFRKKLVSPGILLCHLSS